MTQKKASTDDIRSAEIILPGKPLADTLSFFTDELGFRIEMIYPADAPRVAVVSAYGVCLRLDAELEGDPGIIRLKRGSIERNAAQLLAPNGTKIEFVPLEEPVLLPPVKGSLVVERVTSGEGWPEGRAGMQYRDLIPDRFGGRFIASHIRIPDGGPVADYVHHHHIHFQMIFCVRGWVRVVYEDQGPPILLEPGDCFLQPPHIRHRVLESSDNMEVVEIACPAEHETLVDHEMELPTGIVDANRDFGGQKFVYHRAKDSIWTSWRIAGFEQQDTGIGRATNGIASAVIVRAAEAVDSASLRHSEEICILFVLDGCASLDCDGADGYKLETNVSVAIPAELSCELTNVSADFKMLEVFLPSQ